MIQRITLLLIAVLFSGLMLMGQDTPDLFKKRPEVYFSFKVNSPEEIHTLTKIISIDNVKDKTVYAYANMKEYLKFMTLGYDITLLPHPGDGPGAEMTDHIDLGPMTTWNYYPTYTAYETLMAQFQSTYPSICRLETIGTLASGRKLLALKISDNVATDEAEPEFFYTSSIHGDETTGYILMLHLADYLLSNYGTNAEVTDMINNMEIFINPLANPDGTYAGGNATVTGATRYNANGVDMNRNYPDNQDGPHPDGYAWQPETMAFMDYASQHHFVASCNFHGGSEVVNYPNDTWATLHADDSWYQYISREYADTVHLHAVSTYMTFLNNGVTNGYAWYEVNGGRQDYMNYYQHCREITIELSNTKLLPTTQLLAHWDYNWRSLILWIKEARYGVHGIITDQVTGSPVAAQVFITGHDINGSEVYSSANLGDYHRPLKAGTYNLTFSSPCYVTQTIGNVVVADHATVTLNVQLVPAAAAAVTTTAATSITSSGAVSGGNVTCTGSSAVTSRGVCWSTVSNPVVTGNHTVDGSGSGIYISQISGLTPSTTYHVRAYATNTSDTYYGADIQFSTACGAVTSFPWNEGFENAGAIPACWTQEQVNTSGVNWVFVAGNGASNPAAAHGGSYDACLKDVNTASNITRLITPQLDLTSVSSPQLKFWHTQAVWSTRQDQLLVYYKTSVSGTWTLLATYTASITVWTQETITLPNPSATYYIDFEGNAKYGRGVCIDDVQVSSSCGSTAPVSISIAASNTQVCEGTSVVFTATPTNGGTTPAYQWKVNAVNAGSNNAVYTYAPVQGDLVSCILTSNATCITGNPATSNTVTMTVNPLLPVSVSIAPSANPVCAGTSVTFTPSPVNGGAPTYQWFKNAADAGTGSTYTYVPVAGDQVFAIMTSSLACKTGSPATSNTAAMTVNPVLTLINSISTTQTTLCEGTSTTITCDHNYPVSGCDWYVNGVIASHDMNLTYIPANNDQVYCVCWVTPDGCWSIPSAMSNTITYTVNPVLPVSVSITASANPADAGTPVMFTATGTNGGSSPVYEWKVNGAVAPGATTATYTYTPVSGDEITCTLTSGELCTSSNPAISNTITMVVNPAVPAIKTLQNLAVSDTRCFNATETIEVSGDGNLFTVQGGGSVTMIAGQNILYYPGTVVESGGYLYGYISPGGPWCVTQKVIASANGTDLIQPGLEQHLFRIYPNPTTGAFMLELNPAGANDKCLVEIYDMKGKRMFTAVMSEEQKHEFSLSGKPAGIYLIRVIGERNSGTTRIIKQD